MQFVFRVVGIASFAALSLFFIAFGAFYLSVTDMLWFHAAAVHEAVRLQVLPLYLALMDLIGAASIGLGLVSFYVVFGPLRRGASGAAYALAAAFSVPLIGAALVAERLSAMTGAPTSWHIMGVLLGVVLTGLICAMLRGRAI